MRVPLLIGEDGEASGIRVLLASDGATLSGRALASAGGEPLPGTMLFLTPSEPGLRRALNSQFITSARFDGSFRLDCAPGSYLLIVWRPDEDPADSVADLISARAAGAQQITLGPGERKTLNVLVPAR
jgi:hypothetical protein